jgi:hypothetical protein
MLIQITLIFIFLTIFFFTYVTHVEQTEFKNQLNLITDDIMGDVNNNLLKIINTQKHIDPNQANIILNGIIDVMEEETTTAYKDSIDSITIENNIIKKKSFYYLYLVIGILIVIISIIMMFNYCIKLKYDIKEGIIIVFFVGITEFLFLTFITTKYISASPNKVRKQVGTAIKSWINKNHPISN